MGVTEQRVLQMEGWPLEELPAGPLKQQILVIKKEEGKTVLR